jgi:hypothetical protein
MCVVTRYELKHIHICDPLTFAHLYLNDDTLEPIRGFAAVKSKPELVATFLKDSKHIELSSRAAHDSLAPRADGEAPVV